jgi:hypothetical protein
MVPALRSAASVASRTSSRTTSSRCSAAHALAKVMPSSSESAGDAARFDPRVRCGRRSARGAVAQHAVERVVHSGGKRVFAAPATRSPRRRDRARPAPAVSRAMTSGRCTVVGEYEQLTRPRRRIDGDVRDKLQLGLGHVGIAGAHDAIHARDGGRAQRHGGDGTGAANGEDVIDCASAAAASTTSATGARRGRRRADDHFTDAGDARRYGAHEQRTRIRGAPAGCVDAHACERIGTTPDDDAGLGRHFDRCGTERGVYGGNVGRCAFERTTQRRVERVKRRVPVARGTSIA